MAITYDVRAVSFNNNYYNLFNFKPRTEHGVVNVYNTKYGLFLMFKLFCPLTFKLG